MKIIAAIMDVVFVKPWFGEFKITRIKKFFVYDPRKVTCCHAEKEVVTSAMHEPRMSPPRRTSDIINIQQEE